VVQRSRGSRPMKRHDVVAKRVRKLEESDAIRDDIDSSILELLQEDGRLSNAAIGRVVGIGQGAVRKRVERLIREGVMRVIGVVDPQAVGYKANAIILLRVKPGALESVTKTLVGMRQVVYLGLITGKYDVCIEVILKEPKELLTFVARDLGAIEGLQELETFYIMDELKYDFLSYSFVLGDREVEKSCS
jgi:Lrp/AsnC family transcriptional regulator for asnA, asnC and gidA